MHIYSLMENEDNDHIQLREKNMCLYIFLKNKVVCLLRKYFFGPFTITENLNSFFAHNTETAVSEDCKNT